MRSRQPDIVLMDVRMPILDGVAATRGYLLKDAPSEDLLHAVRVTMRGDSFLDPSVASKLVAEFARLPEPDPSKPNCQPLIDPLTEREIEILSLLANGGSNREIAQRLHLAEGTVKNYVSSILSKLAVRDRTQAALRAREMGLI